MIFPQGAKSLFQVQAMEVHFVESQDSHRSLWNVPVMRYGPAMERMQIHLKHAQISEKTRQGYTCAFQTRRRRAAWSGVSRSLSQRRWYLPVTARSLTAVIIRAQTLCRSLPPPRYCDRDSGSLPLPARTVTVTQARIQSESLCQCRPGRRRQ